MKKVEQLKLRHFSKKLLYKKASCLLHHTIVIFPCHHVSTSKDDSSFPTSKMYAKYIINIP